MKQSYTFANTMERSGLLRKLSLDPNDCFSRKRLFRNFRIPTNIKFNGIMDLLKYMRDKFKKEKPEQLKLQKWPVSNRRKAFHRKSLEPVEELNFDNYGPIDINFESLVSGTQRQEVTVTRKFYAGYKASIDCGYIGIRNQIKFCDTLIKIFNRADSSDLFDANNELKRNVDILEPVHRNISYFAFDACRDDWDNETMWGIHMDSRLYNAIYDFYEHEWSFARSIMESIRFDNRGIIMPITPITFEQKLEVEESQTTSIERFPIGINWKRLWFKKITENRVENHRLNTLGLILELRPDIPKHIIELSLMLVEIYLYYSYKCTPINSTCGWFEELYDEGKRLNILANKTKNPRLTVSETIDSAISDTEYKRICETIRKIKGIAT